MQIGQLDHVNIKTANLDAMVQWYCDILGMQNGERPPFPFPGAWLYAGKKPVVHLVDAPNDPQGLEPKIEHFALTASDLSGFLARLTAADIAHKTVRVPGIGVLQVNLHDVDGNHIHIDFSPEEADALGL